MSAIVSSKAISSITKPIAPIKFIIFLPVGVNRTSYPGVLASLKKRALDAAPVFRYLRLLSEYIFDVVWTDRLANFNCAELARFLLHQESQQY